MREIKFRYWETDFKRMTIADGNNTFELFEQNSYPVMQFTGLKDSKGVEIYEGDILVCREMHDSNLDYWQNNEAVPFEVVWCETGWVIPARDELMNFEVIGNVYEHPHLLEVKP